MSDIRQLQLARWECIRKAGMLRFVLTHGLRFGVLFGVLIYIISPPPLHWYITTLVFCGAGLVWGASMWFVTMWQYDRARRRL